ncbi:MAG: AtpZ/AtpI family protein [Bacteroidales bacterium]
MGNIGKKPNKKLGSDYARYSSITIQIVIVIILFTYGGVQADKYLNIYPVLTLIGAIGGVAIALYLVVRELLKK